MAIDITTLFEQLGKFFKLGNAIVTSMATTIPGLVEDAMQELGVVDLDMEAVRNNVNASLRGYQAGGDGGLSTLVSVPVQELIIRTVRADNPQPDLTITTAVAELIRQMIDQSETLKATTPGISPSYGSGNVGDGVVVTSTKRGDGKVNAFILAEDIECTSDAEGSWTILGEASEGNVSSVFYPSGSGAGGASFTINAGVGSLLTNGSFEDQSDESAHLPDGWIANPATLGTTLKLTSVEVQTVAIGGTPTGGFYTLTWANAAGQSQTTVPLNYAATGSAVQSALQDLAGLGAVSVATTGTSPNLTHTITFYDVTNPAQLTSTSSMTGGSPSITHNTTTAGSAHVMRGARSVEFDSNGSQLTAIHQLLNVAATTQYAVNLWAKADVVPAGGVITVDLVDGIGGAVIADDEGTNNSYTFNCSGLSNSEFTAESGVFRLPSVMPPVVYLRVRISTAVSSGTSIFIDDVAMVEMSEFYPGGPSFTFFGGPTAFNAGDTATLAVTTNATDTANGAMHRWLNRSIDLASKAILFPVDASPTQADSLLS